MRFPRPGPDLCYHGAWVVAGAFLYSAILSAAGVYPRWAIPFGMLGAISGYCVPWAVTRAVRKIRKRGSK